MTENLTPETAIARLVEAEATAKAATAEAKALKAWLLEQFPHEGTHKIGAHELKIATSRAFDAEGFERIYPAETNPHLYKQAVNPAALPPALKNEFMVPSSMRLTAR